MRTQHFLAAAGALAMMCAPQAAQAASSITFDRAALSNPTAVDALYADVRRAAQRECRLENAAMSRFGPAARRKETERCTAETVENALRAIGSPALHALHAARERQTVATRGAFMTRWRLWR